MERAFVLLDRGHAFNGVYVVSLVGPLGEALLREGLSRLQMRHPALRARLVQAAPGDDRRLLLTDEGAGPVPLAIVPREDDDSWQKVAERELNQRFSEDSDHLTRVVWVRGAARSEIVFGQHHVVCDALSITYAVRDLLQDLAALHAGISSPIESLPLRPPLPALLPRSTRGLRRFRFMRRFFYKHVLFRPLRRARKLPVEKPAPPEHRRSGLVHARLSAQMTQALATQAEREQTSLHALLCAAFLLSAYDVTLAATTHRNARVNVGCASAVSLRRELNPSVGEEMGLYISQVTTFHCLARLGVSPSTGALAREVKARLAATLRDGEQYLTMPLIGMFIPGGRRPGPKFVKRFDGGSPAAMLVTNIGALPIAVNYGPFVVKACHFAVSPSVVSPLVVTASRCAGALQLNLIHVEPLCSAERTRAILAGALQRLSATAELPDDADAVGELEEEKLEDALLHQRVADAVGAVGGKREAR